MLRLFAMVAAAAVLALESRPALALDVTGNWSLTGGGLSRIKSASFAQSGSTLTLCLSGWGTAATGTIDEDSGAFTLLFDPSFADSLYEFGVCSLEWNGTFAPDGTGLSGDEIYSVGCIPHPCCLAAQTNPISGSRSGAFACCGNGVLEGGEECDELPRTTLNCCAGDCRYEPAGHFCGATDQCHLKECNASGSCEALSPVDCGPCYRCDPADGCLADIRIDCRQPGRGARLRAVGEGTATKFTWKWRGGEDPETTPASLGDPTATTDFELCVFTSDLVPSGLARLAADLEAGGTCDQQPCWKSVGSGFLYRDPASSNGGVLKTLLKVKPNGRSLLKTKGVATNLSPPLAGPVTVQMTARDATSSSCWSSTFMTPSINQRGRYSAKLP